MLLGLVCCIFPCPVFHVTTCSKNDAGCCFILGATHTKLKGIWWMRLCHGAYPGGNSRKRVQSVCDELVSFFLFFFVTLCFSNFFDILWSLKFFSFSLPVNRKCSLRCKEIHPVQEIHFDWQRNYRLVKLQGPVVQKQINLIQD